MQKIMLPLFLAVPVAFGLELAHFGGPPLFATAALGIIPCAWLMGRATEELSFYLGEKWGGFLNASFGNATELIIAFFALNAGLYEVVKASIVGSVLGNILLVLGASLFAGGLKNGVQKSNRLQNEMAANMLSIAAIGVCLPAFFLIISHVGGSTDILKYEPLSLSIAGILFVTYICGTIYSFRQRNDVFGSDAHIAKKPAWSMRKAIIILSGSTIVIAFLSEALVTTLESITATFGISEFFLGMIIIPIIGNAAEHTAAIWMAMKNRIELSIEIAIGSSLQIILFVTPVLVLAGAIIGKPLSIIFNAYELVAFAAAVLIANRVVGDSKTNWLEGLQLLAVYGIAAICFMLV